MADPSPGVAADAPDLTEALQRHRNVARAMSENGASADVLRGWHAFAGWLRAGCPDEQDVRGQAPDADAELARVRAAVTALADELGREWAGLHPTHRVVLQARLRETLGAS